MTELSVRGDVEESLGAEGGEEHVYKPVPGKSSMFSERQGRDIMWRGVNFTVKGKMKVLSDCWGCVEHGKVCAIMGPSGSGKSSLLNVLAGRSASAPGISVSGHVSVDGVDINPVAYRRNIAYVMQDDALMATATPREALRFSAALRLKSVSASDIENLVDQTLDALGILDCADTFIGNALLKGISGGQRKRTSVGVELITNPSLLFLDEPTSGLDSYTAYQLIKVLRKIASSNATVLCTIHQPSSEVFHLFDLAIFLKAGRVLYSGPVKGIVDRFMSIGHPCPANYNPADHVMFITQTESTESLEQCGAFQNAPGSSKSEGECNGNQKGDTVDEDTAREGAPSCQVIEELHANFFKQVAWLVHREFHNTIRNKPALAGRFGVTIILNIIFGLIFLGAGNNDDSDQDNFNAHNGVVVMTMISAMFGSAQPTLLEFPNERPMFMREFSTGTYGTPAYTVAKLCMELPLSIAQSMVQMIIIYFMADLRGNYFALAGSALGTGLASASVAVLLGCLVTDPKQATEMMPLLLVPQILFAGFFIRTEQIPVWLRWAQYLCSLKYGLNLFITNEFASYRESCSGDAAANCIKIKEANDIDPSHWWVYVLVLAVLFLGFRIMAMIVLSKRAVRFY